MHNDMPNELQLEFLYEISASLDPLYGLRGYFLGDTIQRLVGPTGIAFLVLAVLLNMVGIVIVRRNEERLEDEAERALPGPLELSFP